MQQGAGHGPFRRRLRVDSAFYLELQYCNEHGLPHSQFLTWHPDDRAKALAFTLEKAAHCVMCGTADWEWDPEQGGKRYAYEAVHKLCQGCLRKESESESSDRRAGFSIELQPVTARSSAQQLIRAQRRAKRR